MSAHATKTKPQASEQTPIDPREVTADEPSESRERFLHNRQERVILEAIRTATSAKGGITDLQMDYLFGRKQQANAREAILQQLKALNLVSCSKSPGGGRLWIAIYPERSNKKGDKK